jgi:cytochrome P450
VRSGNGYWALVRHADVSEASRRQDVFSSEPSATSIQDFPAYMGRFFGSLINMDDPRHAKIRRIVSRALITIVRAARDLHRLAARLGRERIKNPTDDLTSALVNANVDGERLTTRGLGSFFLLLVVAGNETTRTSISHALKLFSDFPDQRKLLLEDFDGRIGGAVEEIVRYSTPVIFMRRNLTRQPGRGGLR